MNQAPHRFTVSGSYGPSPTAVMRMPLLKRIAIALRACVRAFSDPYAVQVGFSTHGLQSIEVSVYGGGGGGAYQPRGDLGSPTRTIGSGGGASVLGEILAKRPNPSPNLQTDSEGHLSREPTGLTSETKAIQNPDVEREGLRIGRQELSILTTSDRESGSRSCCSSIQSGSDPIGPDLDGLPSQRRVPL
uniref:Uncharacterized protein n=1 Tax=Mycena chlorophos TaxID=658473 RepID=A0ABQ0KYM1_MYCCL|nr:predicted protein [Mycena chlorophos]